MLDRPAGRAGVLPADQLPVVLHGRVLRTTVCFSPESGLIQCRLRRRAVPGGIETSARRTPLMRDRLVEHAIDHERGHRMRRPFLIAENRGDDGRDRRQPVGKLAAQPVRHHAAIGHARRVNAPRIDRIVFNQLVDQRTHEAHIVRIALHGVAAAVAGIPGEELVPESAASIGIGHDEAFLQRLVGESRHALCALRIAAASVQHQHERHRSLAHDCFTWRADQVASFGAPVHQRLPRPSGTGGKAACQQAGEGQGNERPGAHAAHRADTAAATTHTPSARLSATICRMRFSAWAAAGQAEAAQCARSFG